jgi:hypothetical protein
MEAIPSKKAIEHLPLQCSEALFETSPNFQLKELTDEQRQGLSAEQQYDLALTLASKTLQKPVNMADPPEDATLEELRLFEARSKIVKNKLTDYYEKTTAVKEMKRWLLDSLTAGLREEWDIYPPGVIFENMQERFIAQSLKKRHALQVEMGMIKMTDDNIVEFIELITNAVIKHAGIRDFRYEDREKIQVLLAAVEGNPRWAERARGISRTIENSPEWPNSTKSANSLVGWRLLQKKEKLRYSWQAHPPVAPTAVDPQLTIINQSMPCQ